MTPKMKHRYFKGRINQWNGNEMFVPEYRELLRQIRALLSIQGGLGQSSQGYPEDYKQRCHLMVEERQLAESIHNALGL